MKDMKTILLVGVLLMTFQCDALACSCIGEITVKKEIKRSDAVFTGSVISIERFTVRDTLLGTDHVVSTSFNRVKIKITSIYKGELRSETVDVITGIGGGDCGFAFEKGKEYIVYADSKTQFSPLGNETARYLSTHICKRTRALDKSEITQIEKLRKPIKH